MEYKILINKEAVPVLIEVPEKPSLHPSSWIKGASSLAEASRLYEQAVSTAIADESKHIQFRDELHVKLYCDDLLRKQKGESLLHVKAKIELPVGQTFDLPENVSVSFDWSTCENDICLCIYFEKSDCGYTRKLAILSKLEEEKKEGAQDVFTIDRKHEGNQCITTVCKNGELIKAERKPLETWEVSCVAPSEEVKPDKWQTIFPNQPKYAMSTNLSTEGMDVNWIDVWCEIENWYGDHTKRETAAQLLIRLQKKFRIEKF